MRAEFWLGALGAAILGLSSGMILQPTAGEVWTGPKGPQLVYSAERAYGPQAPSTGWASIGPGPVGDWVYGTDWVHPKPPSENYQTAAYVEPAPLEDTPVAPPAAPPVYQSVAARYTIPSVDGSGVAVSVWRDVEPAADHRGQLRQVIVVDDQRRGQVDDLSHRPDPGPQAGEPLAKRSTLDRLGELHDADGAQGPDVDHPRQVTAGL